MTGAVATGREAEAKTRKMRALVIEDDPDLARQMKEALEGVGYATDVAGDGEEGHFLGDVNPYDIVILDLGLPKLDGVMVLQRWRKDGRRMPVLILTARNRWSEKVLGFDAGADDYVTKPFHMEELLARVRALVRRAAGQVSSMIVCGPLEVDTRAARAMVSGRLLKLTALEYRLLAYLAHHQGRVITRTELMDHLYEHDAERDSNTIEVFIGRLRRKLGVNLIQTARGLGYHLAPPQDDH